MNRILFWCFSWMFLFSSFLTALPEKMYVANLSNDTVTVMNGSNGGLITILSGGSFNFSQPVSVALTPDLNYAYVCNRGNSSVTVIRTSDDSFVANLMGGSYIPRPLRLCEKFPACQVN